MFIGKCASVWEAFHRGELKNNPPTICRASERSVCCLRNDVIAETTVNFNVDTRNKRVRVSEKSTLNLNLSIHIDNGNLSLKYYRMQRVWKTSFRGSCNSVVELTGVYTHHQERQVSA